MVPAAFVSVNIFDSYDIEQTMIVYIDLVSLERENFLRLSTIRGIRLTDFFQYFSGKN